MFDISVRNLPICAVVSALQSFMGDLMSPKTRPGKEKPHNKSVRFLNSMARASFHSSSSRGSLITSKTASLRSLVPTPRKGVAHSAKSDRVDKFIGQLVLRIHKDVSIFVSFDFCECFSTVTEKLLSPYHTRCSVFG